MKGVSVLAAIVGLTALGAGHQAAQAEILLVEDFLDGREPNALGGDYGSWNLNEDDPTQRCRDTFDQAHAYGRVGYCLRLDYDVDSPNPAFCGLWMRLQGVDARAYATLLLSVRGDADHGFTDQFFVELKSEQEAGRFLLRGITDAWQVFRIPLASFEGLHDRSALKELVIVFDDLRATKKAGTIYVDEIAFEN